MRVEVGPLPAEGVLMWLAYARTVLAQVMSRPETYGTSLSDEQVAAFESYLDEWELVATREPQFHWVSDVDPDKARQLADTWVRLSEGMTEAVRRRGYEMLPQEGKAFNDALATAVIIALAGEAGD